MGAGVDAAVAFISSWHPDLSLFDTCMLVSFVMD
jgi:hypothetical protein